jgi:hypothetical protein
MDWLGICKTCGAPEEITFHTLFDYTCAKLFWKEIKGLGIKITSLHPMSWPTDLIEGKLVKEEQSCVILCGVWAVWTERNVVWHGERGRPIATCVHWALETTLDLQQAGKEKKRRPTKPHGGWIPPRLDIIKINVDASFSSNAGDGFIGLIMRDHL